MAGADSYEVERYSGTIYSVNGLVFHDTGLASETQYSYRVRTVKGGVRSDWSYMITAMTTVSDAEIPTGIRSTSTLTSIRIDWDPVATAVGYDIMVDGQIIDNGTNIYYVHSGISSGTTYVYRLRIRKAGNGVGNWSAEFRASANLGIPGSIRAENLNNAMRISWGVVAMASSYEIEVDGGNIYEVLTPEYMHTGLTLNTRYTYRVRAVSANGKSDWSEAVSFDSGSGECLVSLEMGKVFNFTLAADGIQDFRRHVYSVSYNPNQIAIVDLCASTPLVDLNIGAIPGTNISVPYYDADTGLVRIIVSSQLGANQEWSGAINSIRFKSIAQSGTAIISYQIHDSAIIS